ncbi:MAG: hypothetical protein ACK5HY_00525, partial [Parahaliea sp.]
DYFNDIEIEVYSVHLSNFSGQNDYSILFRQHINELSVPASKIIMYGDGSVKRLNLRVANPNSILYDKRSWLSENDLLKIATSLLMYEKNYEPQPSARFYHSIINSPLHQSLRPVYTLIAGPYEVVIDSVTVEKIVLTHHFVSESRCIRTGTGNPAEDKNCNDTIGGAAQYEKYMESGSCLNNHPACGDTAFLEIYMGINGVKNWLTNLGWPTTPPSNFHFRVNSVFASSSYVYGGMFHTYPTVFGPVLSFSPVMVSGSGATTDRRKDVGGHEAAHMWTNRANSHFATMVKYSGYLGKGLSEAIADSARAMQTNNYVQYTGSPENDRYLNPVSPHL